MGSEGRKGAAASSRFHRKDHSELSGNRYLTLTKTKTSTNSLTLPNNQKRKVNSFNNIDREKFNEDNLHLRQEIKNQIKD